MIIDRIMNVLLSIEEHFIVYKLCRVKYINNLNDIVKQISPEP